MTEVDRTRYALSAEDNDRIFHEEIVPLFLAPATAQRDPVAVFLGGQTGAGKSRTSDLLHAALQERGTPVVVDLDQLKPFHPRYAELMRQDDSTAGAYTSIDGRAWMAKLMAHAAAARVDVLMESAMRGPSEFLEPVQLYHEAGYRVGVAILAVPAAQSRLGVLDRYWTQVEQDGSGRVINTDIHDGSYRGVLDCADAIDRGATVDTVTVIRRGNIVVYQNTRTGDGGWAVAPGARAAVEAERHRPWTAEEREEFAATFTRLRHAMGPQWQTELDRIQALRDSAAARAARVFDPTSWILTTPVRRIGGPATGTGEEQRPPRSPDQEQWRGRGLGR